MTTILDSLNLPLHGSRLIEASAGTGKTWTIAALYLRLILGHGAEGECFARALLPEDILVMTFTRAATQELKERIRDRLQTAARYFRSPGHATQPDPFLETLLADYSNPKARAQAAHQLALAADAMDDSAISTIDAWCQRTLREHAFATGSDFRETLLLDETDLRDDAVRDFWRQEIYPLSEPALSEVLQLFSCPEKVRQETEALCKLDPPLPAPKSTLADWLPAAATAPRRQLATLKAQWAAEHDAFAEWLLTLLQSTQNPLNGNSMKAESVANHLIALREWVDEPAALCPAYLDKCQRLTAANLPSYCNKNETITPPRAAALLNNIFTELETIAQQFTHLHGEIRTHAAAWINARLSQLKAQSGQVSFTDYQQRLARVLHDNTQGPPLAARLRQKYPAALIDEFQDTSALQYQIFDDIYHAADNNPDTLLLLIGDPKQSIYAFRGADIDSYLQARRLTEGRHYALGTNYRSSHALVSALNALYIAAEHDDPQGAFAYGAPGADNPLPYQPVQAHGHKKIWRVNGKSAPALTFWGAREKLNKGDYLERCAAQAAECIAGLLNNPEAEFAQEGEPTRRLKAKDIAILVRDRHEAASIRQALNRRQLRSVFLSARDSVYASEEARELPLWLEAVAAPEDARRLRVALALPLLGQPLNTLDAFNQNETTWEAQLEQFQDLSRQWRRQGVLAMLHHSIHQFGIAARLLTQPEGERRLTNLLHLGELLQQASATLDGPEALIRHLREAIAAGSDQSDAHILRLESDAELLRVVTIHAAKGLQYPLVFLPFIATRKAAKASPFTVSYSAEGQSAIHWESGDTAVAERARLQEDLRLLYVALTRAEHALWLGLATPKTAGTPIFADSAIAHLLGSQCPVRDLATLLADCARRSPEIVVETLPDDIPTTLAVQHDNNAHNPPAEYTASFEKHWGVASFSHLVRGLPADPSAPLTPRRAQTGAPWHRYPQGMNAGTFLHDQLQRLALTGYAQTGLDYFAEQLHKACIQAGLSDWAEETAEWLQAIVHSPLAPLTATLCDLRDTQSEMAFWFPSDTLRSDDLDRLCQQHIFPGADRPRLPQRVVHGMMRGFMDLVFEQGGRYYVLDYKSNVLGCEDANYHAEALRIATLSHRYELQSSLYQLALHRLLRQRMGSHYRPETHLGGTLFFFLRGLQGPEQGMLHLPANLTLLDALDNLFGLPQRATQP
ncbi:exodeoxyribonuclease V subunit beta [Acidithiobacillus sp.]|uniref:exodeoxyribonuclease V subunit beta n=1 Tax=Acidithiobacillus sp. TaxID=1872118 RepID=UPI0025BEC7C8|nr:exodeoxyribonuclease V subunit beta [Acidithiobacillus sp.]MCK9188761.1 exodeoxyribonuclease V subunit beta [Acidithiobacillus sp.]MCK9359697.1 exodeoxyribonuclease V subunit beta [Acidithiobacillus sp.]